MAFITNFTKPSNSTALPATYRWALLSIYTLVLVGGTISMSLTINILQSNVRSFTTTAVINLIIVHILFLLTVPFRIYYYIAGEWRLGEGFCRVVSGMIHAHIYLAFVFYVIILVTRYLAFYKQTDRIEFYRRLHAIGASVAVWLIMLTIALPVAILEYGSPDSNVPTPAATYQCFSFGGQLNDRAVAVFNYILSSIIIIISLTLTLCQVSICILAKVYRTHGNLTFSHQEFWAQVKSLSFVAVLIVCLVPYNAFRIYYVKNMNDQASLERVNEVFLAITTLSCLDMLIFVRRPANNPCQAGYCCCLL
uniref:G protein-coupled receptor 141 n=1 Tax=Myripristis murdjan TaxID=586833 RepID=A0A668AW03_9TELE